MPYSISTLHALVDIPKDSVEQALADPATWIATLLSSWLQRHIYEVGILTEIVRIVSYELPISRMTNMPMIDVHYEARVYLPQVGDECVVKLVGRMETSAGVAAPSVCMGAIEGVELKCLVPDEGGKDVVASLYDRLLIHDRWLVQLVHVQFIKSSYQCICKAIKKMEE